MDSKRSPEQRAINLLGEWDAADDWKVCQMESFAICHPRQCDGFFERSLTFVGSSRLPQKLDEIPRFFDGLLKLAVQLDSERDVLITGQGTACDAMVRRVGEIFRIPVLNLISVPLGADKLSSKIEELRKKGSSNDVLVFDFENRGLDCILASVATQVIVLSMRSNGKLQAAVAKRLEDKKPTRILVEPTLTKKVLTDELLSRGAAGWYLFGEHSKEKDVANSELRFANEVDSEQYLLHWTRRRVGPWPEQSEAEYLDDLIFHASRKDHREIASLRRILATERILATSELTRDPRPVVCFSDVAFDELKERRVFRRHLSRWDFEPYGVAIAKSWLAERGCRGVMYGDQQTWESIDEKDRPFFQLNDPDGKIDWSVEKEWRVVGDVDLRMVPVDAAVVFVPTEADAKEIVGVCRWPIVVVES